MTNSNRKDPVVAVEIFHGMTCGLHGAEDVAKCSPEDAADLEAAIDALGRYLEDDYV